MDSDPVVHRVIPRCGRGGCQAPAARGGLGGMCARDSIAAIRDLMRSGLDGWHLGYHPAGQWLAYPHRAARRRAADVTRRRDTLSALAADLLTEHEFPHLRPPTGPDATEERWTTRTEPLTPAPV